MSGEVDCAEDFLVNSRFRRDAREFELSVESFFLNAIAVSSSMAGAEPVPEQGAVALPAGFDLGIYRYSPLADRLVPASAVGTVDELLATFCGGDEVINTSQAAMVLLLVARPWRAMREYGPRGLRPVLLETGQSSSSSANSTRGTRPAPPLSVIEAGAPSYRRRA